MNADCSEGPFRRDGHILGSGPREPAAQVAIVISAEDHIRGSGRQHAFARVRHDVAIAAPEKTHKRRQCPAAPDSFQEGFNQFVHGREFEWVIGAGLDAPYGTRHVTLAARYTFGLTPVFGAEPSDSDSEKRNRVFSVIVGYRFK
jgi:hypothetical protein